jgi:hypothetical protein
MDVSALSELNASQECALVPSASHLATPHRLLGYTLMGVSALTTRNALQAIATPQSASAHQPVQTPSQQESMKTDVSAAPMMNASLNTAHQALASPSAPRQKLLASSSMDVSVLQTKNAIQDYV